MGKKSGKNWHWSNTGTDTVRQLDKTVAKTQTKIGSTTKTSRTGTTVDLGDDLLTKTAQADGSPQREDVESFGSSSDSASNEKSIEVQYENARILINEGLIDDAKKLLRKILIYDSKHAAARVALQEILDKELKDLLSDNGGSISRRKVSDGLNRRDRRNRGPQPSREELLAALESELGTDAAALHSAEDEKWLSKTVLDEAMEIEDRIDLGVALIEIGAYSSAIHQLRSAIEHLQRDPSTHQEKLISANALLATAFLRFSQPFEAMQVIHPVLRDPGVEVGQKIEFFYMMGSAQEMAKGRKAALPWFHKVFEIDPHYRNISEKLRKPNEPK